MTEHSTPDRHARRATLAGSASVQAPGRLDALFLLNELAVGGSERKTVRLSNALAACNVRTGVACLNGPQTLAPMLDTAVHHWELGRRGKFSLAALARLIAIVRQQQPRVLISVNLYPALYAAALSLALGARAPAIVALMNTTYPSRRERWRLPLYTRALSRFDWLVYGCKAQQEIWLRGSRRLGQRAGVIYNGVDLEEFHPGAVEAARIEGRRKLGYAPGAYVIGAVGRLVALKNQRVLIDAVGWLRGAGLDARLLIAGDGPLRQALEEHAASLGVDAFTTFAGSVADVRPLIGAMDVFVLPSRNETFSNAALEAMAMSKPVILSRVGGAAEMVDDGREGFVVAPDQLADRLPQLLLELARDPGRARQIGERGRARVERDFSLHRMVEQHANLIRRFAS